MLNKNETTTQQAISLGPINQAANDLLVTNNYYNVDFTSISFYESDIKDIIVYFNNNISNITDNPFPDLTPVNIPTKNLNNKVSKEYFDQMKSKDLPHFGKIRSFLKDSRNEEFVNMYLNTTAELQIIVLAYINTVDSFDKIILSLYQYVIRSCKEDKEFMKMRSKILLFLHFMYYNCDIGIK